MAVEGFERGLAKEMALRRMIGRLLEQSETCRMWNVEM
jgi:hypothetical protein